MKTGIWFIWSAAFFCIMSAAADDCSRGVLWGTLLDSNSTPLSGIRIYAGEQRTSAISSPDGRFVLFPLSPGQQALSFEDRYGAPYTIKGNLPVAITGGDSSAKTFVLERHAATENKCETQFQLKYPLPVPEDKILNRGTTLIGLGSGASVYIRVSSKCPLPTMENSDGQIPVLSLSVKKVDQNKQEIPMVGLPKVFNPATAYKNPCPAGCQSGVIWKYDESTAEVNQILLVWLVPFTSIPKPTGGYKPFPAGFYSIEVSGVQDINGYELPSQTTYVRMGAR